MIPASCPGRRSARRDQQLDLTDKLAVLGGCKPVVVSNAAMRSDIATDVIDKIATSLPQ